MNSAFSANKRLVWRLVILLCLIISVSTPLLGFDTEQPSSMAVPPHSHRPDNMFTPDDGCVPDSATAIRIAEAVWLPIYGEGIYDRRPFSAELILDSVWAVAGSIPANMLGGVPYIEIQKSDGRILGVGHGE
jgi:hypothetical protein